MNRSTWQHLRIPSSLYLMPIFAFAASQYPFADIRTLVVSFLAIHLFLYPADNGFNAYFERNKESIARVRELQPVSENVLWLALGFDIAGILLAWTVSWQFALMMLTYGLVSKAYTAPAIRLKQYSFFALFIVAVFQGGFAYLMSYLALHHLTFGGLADPKIWVPALLCAIMILGFYPLTQIYQHKEDREHGDTTASMILGANGTFIFSAVVFLMGSLGFYLYFNHYYHRVVYFLLFQIFLSPLFAFFILWYFAFLIDKAEANYRNAGILNKLAACCLMAFFITMAILQNWY